MVAIENNAFVVTGGASGLGASCVKELLRRKGKVVIFDMNVDAGREIEKNNLQTVIFCEVDVTDEKSVSAGLETAVQKFGTLAGVVNCAGIAAASRVLSSRGAVHSLEGFKRVISINLIGTFNVLRLAAAIMAKQAPFNADGERGCFLNVASVAAFEGQIGQAAYSASKAGIVGMTLPIARELGSLGIRINAIAPGVFGTPLVVQMPEKAIKSLEAQVPFPKRLGKPDEFGRLCADMIENSYMNGAVYRIDGSIRMSAM